MKKEIYLNYKIWKIILDANGEFLYIETRESKSKKSEIFKVSPEEGTVSLVQKLEEEDYWYSLTATTNNVLLFTHFGERNLPLSNGIMAINALSGGKMWTLSDFRIIGVTREFIHAEKLIPFPEKCWIDVLNGKEVIQASRKDISYPPHSPLPCFYPEILLSETEDFQEKAKQIYLLTGKIAHRHIDFLHLNGTDIIHYYTKSGTLSEYILLSKSKKLLMDECLNESLSTMILEPFFVLKNRLITLKSEKTLCLIYL